MNRTAYILSCVLLFAGALYGGYALTVNSGRWINQNAGSISPSKVKSTMWTKESATKEWQEEEDVVSGEEFENYTEEWKREKSSEEFVQIFESTFGGMNDKQLKEKYSESWSGRVNLFLEEWAKQHPEGILEYFKNHKPISDCTDLESIFVICSRQRPEKTWDYYVSNKEECYSYNALCSLVKSYAEKNPAEAWEKLQTLTPIEQERAVGRFILGVIVKSPESLMDYMTLIDWDRCKENRNLRSQMLNNISFWKRKGMDTSACMELLPKEWLEGGKRNTGEEKYKNITSLEESMSALTPKEQKDKIAANLHQISRNEGFRETWDLIEKYTPDMKEEDMERYSYLLSDWIEIESEDFMKWYKGLPDGVVKEAAAYAHASKRPFMKHEDNLALAMQVKEGDKRYELVVETMSRWYREFPEEAVKKMEELNIKEDHIKEIKEIHDSGDRSKLGNVRYFGGD